MYSLYQVGNYVLISHPVHILSRWIDHNSSEQKEQGTELELVDFDFIKYIPDTNTYLVEWRVLQDLYSEDELRSYIKTNGVDVIEYLLTLSPELRDSFLLTHIASRLGGDIWSFIRITLQSNSFTEFEKADMCMTVINDAHSTFEHRV